VNDVKRLEASMKAVIVLGLITVGVFVSAPQISGMTELDAAGDRIVVNVAHDHRHDAGSIKSNSAWAPALEPITMFLGGAGLMGFGWAARRLLFSRPTLVAGQTILQDRMIYSPRPSTLARLSSE
jgi:hypothetical protein